MILGVLEKNKNELDEYENQIVSLTGWSENAECDGPRAPTRVLVR
jgi:hypothetical protein